MTIQIKFDPHFCCLGVYWNYIRIGRILLGWQITICLLPFLPIHIIHDQPDYQTFTEDEHEKAQT